MLYMVVERFKEGAAPEIYRRLRDDGRMMPEALEYVSSWIDLEFKTCYQLMRTDDETLFSQWTDKWNDLIEFEITPVRTSAEAVEIISHPERSAEKSKACPVRDEAESNGDPAAEP